MPVEGGEVSNVAITRDKCVFGVSTSEVKLRGAEIKLGFQAFTLSRAALTCVAHEELELCDTFFAANRQCCLDQLRLLFTRERTDDTVPLCGILDGFLGIF